jgi:hypothetical protein
VPHSDGSRRDTLPTSPTICRPQTAFRGAVPLASTITHKEQTT